MSILSYLRKGRNKGYARPAAPVRFPSPRRKTTPFAFGIENDTIRSLGAWVAGDHAFELIEDALWFEREAGAYPFTLYWFARGQAESKGFDTASDAELYAWHLATPLPAVDEAPELPEAACFEPTDEDVAWHAAHEHEVASEMDQWLDAAAPDNYADLAIEGGVEW